MRKKVIILDRPKGCRLANQLWNFVNVYAYCLDRNYECQNYSFFEDKRVTDNSFSVKTYYDFFDIPGSWFPRFFLWIHVLLSKISAKPRIYYRYVDFIKRKFPESVVRSGDEKPFILPPSKGARPEDADKIESFEKGNSSVLYLDGWLFRNPDGIEKHRIEITKRFGPEKDLARKVYSLLTPLKEKYKKVIGVHVRQGDYRRWQGGIYYFKAEEVRNILDEYLNFSGLKRKDAVFLLCSDEKINTGCFDGLNFEISGGNAAHDLFALAACDVIIGSRSTYGPWAALYGNMPFIMFERQMDWEYYRGKDMNKYFDNEKVGLLA